jgi:hypothetical protein
MVRFFFHKVLQLLTENLFFDHIDHLGHHFIRLFYFTSQSNYQILLFMLCTNLFCFLAALAQVLWQDYPS